jgi:hypothetical protein
MSQLNYTCLAPVWNRRPDLKQIAYQDARCGRNEPAFGSARRENGVAAAPAARHPAIT